MQRGQCDQVAFCLLGLMDLGEQAILLIHEQNSGVLRRRRRGRRRPDVACHDVTASSVEYVVSNTG
jgi:hypothetical protein